MQSLPASLSRRLLGGILALTLAWRLGLLLLTPQFVDGDEALFGMMGKYIVEGRERPLTVSGVPYGGGTAESYLAAGAYAALGMSPVSLRMVALVMSLLVMLSLVRFCRAHLGETTALVTAALAAVTPVFGKWNLRVGGGYMEVVALVPLALHWALSAEQDPRAGRGALALRGLVCGLAVWVSEMAIPFVVLAVGGTVFHLIRQRQARRLPLLALGGVLGLAPVIAINLTTGFANLHHLVNSTLATHGVPLGARLFASFVRTFAYDLPDAFMPDNIHNFTPATGFAWFQYGVALGALGVAALAARSESTPARRILLAGFALYLAGYLFSPISGTTPRYLLPLMPFFLIGTGHLCATLWGAGRTLARAAGAGLLGALLVGGMAQQATLPRETTVVDGVRVTAGRALPAVLARLEALGIRHVYTTYFLQWRLIFHSQERVIASCRGLGGPSRHPAYDEQVDRSDRIAYLFHRDDPQRAALAEYLRARRIPYREEVMDGLALISGLGRPVRPWGG